MKNTKKVWNGAPVAADYDYTKVWTGAPVAADYDYTVDSGERYTGPVSGRTYRLVSIPKDSMTWQMGRYGSFMLGAMDEETFDHIKTRL